MNKQVGNVQLMQKINRLKVLDCIRRNPGIVRPAVAEQTGLSLSSITNIVSFLIEKGLVSETGFENADRIGRKAVLLKFCPSAYYLICVTLSTHRITTALTDLDGRRLEVSESVFSDQTADEALRQIQRDIAVLLARCEAQRVLAIGIAVSALVLPDGSVAVSTRLHWDRPDLKTELSQKFQKPVFITNTSVARAHYCNQNTCGGHMHSMLFIDLMDGVGAVHFYDGHCNRSVLGEIGHTTVEKDGDACFCGNHGCLEIMCSMERVVAQYRAAGKGEDLTDVKNGSLVGEPVAVRLLQRAGEYLGIGIANAVNVLNPDTVVLNAGQYLQCPQVLDKAIETARLRTFSALAAHVTFETTDISDAMMTEGMAQSLCECIFALDFHGDIFA